MSGITHLKSGEIHWISGSIIWYQIRSTRRIVDLTHACLDLPDWLFSNLEYLSLLGLNPPSGLPCVRTDLASTNTSSERPTLQTFRLLYQSNALSLNKTAFASSYFPRIRRVSLRARGLLACLTWSSLNWMGLAHFPWKARGNSGKKRTMIRDFFRLEPLLLLSHLSASRSSVRGYRNLIFLLMYGEKMTQSAPWRRMRFCNWMIMWTGKNGLRRTRLNHFFGVPPLELELPV